MPLYMKLQRTVDIMDLGTWKTLDAITQGLEVDALARSIGAWRVNASGPLAVSNHRQFLVLTSEVCSLLAQQ